MAPGPAARDGARPGRVRCRGVQPPGMAPDRAASDGARPSRVRCRGVQRLCTPGVRYPNERWPEAADVAIEHQQGRTQSRSTRPVVDGRQRRPGAACATGRITLLVAMRRSLRTSGLRKALLVGDSEVPRGGRGARLGLVRRTPPAGLGARLGLVTRTPREPAPRRVHATASPGTKWPAGASCCCGIGAASGIGTRPRPCGPAAPARPAPAGTSPAMQRTTLRRRPRRPSRRTYPNGAISV